jgi:NAD(P)-dependent dehydrogenase (short-subunit alcohol dehydrogenase family)
VRTWALEMTRAGVTVNTVVPVAATAMTRTIPFFEKAIAADDRGESMPDFFRKDLGFGTAQDVAGLIAWLAVSPDAARVTGQAIGVGGDRLQLWSHPEPVFTEYRDGGWTFDALTADLPGLLDGRLQTVGETFPELPEELRPS